MGRRFRRPQFWGCGNLGHSEGIVTIKLLALRSFPDLDLDFDDIGGTLSWLEPGDTETLGLMEPFFGFACYLIYCSKRLR